jgi:hypothetical protein
MKLKKMIGRVVLGAFVLSLIPYKIKWDKETDTLELRSLLWGVKKTPGAEKDSYTVAVPGSGLDEKEEAPAEEDAEQELA